MSSRLRYALILLTLALTGCGGAPADIRERIKAFQDLANAGLPDIRPEDVLHQDDWEFRMAPRTRLGRMIRTTEANVLTWSGPMRPLLSTSTRGQDAKLTQVVTVWHNTDFERGQALEIFVFLIDDTGTRMRSYGFQIGKRAWCPLIKLNPNWCSVEDIPGVAQPGEGLFGFMRDHDRFDFELRRHAEGGGVEAQLLKNGDLLTSRRFDTREQASRWAEETRKDILKRRAF